MSKMATLISTNNRNFFKLQKYVNFKLKSAEF